MPRMIGRWSKALVVAGALLAGLGTVTLPVSMAAAQAGGKAKKASEQSFFNSVEVRSTNLKLFKKWTSAVSRFTKEVAEAKKGKCSSTEMNTCNYEQWGKFLGSLRKKSPLEKMQQVNDFMNRAKYITDPVNWGRKDYWESPGEFMSRFGDCEDYAISKYMSLKMLGFKDSELRVVAVKDLNLKVGHAVLVVFVDGKTYLLDNQIKQVIETTKVRHYQPVFSINSTFWWKHRI